MFFSFVAGKSCNTCETFTRYSYGCVYVVTSQNSVLWSWHDFCVCVCVYVCVRTHTHVCVWERDRVARFLMSSGHWAERVKAYHVSVCNDTLDNAFCVHSNKMVNLNSTKVPAVSEKYMRQTAMQRLGWQTSIQCQYKCSLCCTVLFLAVWTYKMVTDDKIMLHCLLWKIQVEECEGMFSGIFSYHISGDI